MENLERLVTESVNERTRALDIMSTLELVTAINNEDKQVALAVEKELPRIAQAVEIIAEALRKGGRLFYVGAGTSGRLGVLDAAECPPTFGVDPELVQGVIAGGPEALVRSVEGVEDDREAGRADLRARGLRAGDVVVAIAASGRTPYALGALEEARAVGARTIALTCNPGSEMERIAELTIAPVVGPEVIAGSTRMKAGTAQKMVLNMLSTGAMVKLGKVYGNLMVDLQPTNAKLMERARRIVMLAAGVDRETAAAALEAAGGKAKVAVVMCLAGVDAETARQALEEADGFVRRAVELLGKKEQ
nr:MAG: N-acetylmuramic acid 6-phosphate etherase [Bacillota bacterium]